MKGKETLFPIHFSFATSDFKGLCGIFLPPFISSPVKKKNTSSYSTVPQMEVISEL